MKFEAFTQIYIRDYVDVALKPKTRQSYIENIAVLNAGLGHIKLCELRPTHINALYKNLQEEGVREKVTAVCKIDLAAILKERGMSLSKAEAITGTSRATIKADARRLLELLQQEPIRWRTIITFDLLSGLRRGELLGLRWCDVDLDQRMICIRQTWNYLPKKGCYVGTPKSRSSERPLKISQTAVLLLLECKSWQERQKDLLGDAWANPDNRVFTKEDGSPFFPDGLTQWFSEFVRRSGLPKVSVHSLRHTYASLLIADGTPLVVVAHNMGHAQASTTANIYAHVIASAEAKAAQVTDRFADVIKPGGTKVAPTQPPSEAAG